MVKVDVVLSFFWEVIIMVFVVLVVSVCLMFVFL